MLKKWGLARFLPFDQVLVPSEAFSRRVVTTSEDRLRRLTARENLVAVPNSRTNIFPPDAGEGGPNLLFEASD